MQIRTLPVYSRLADVVEVRALGLWDQLPLNADGMHWQLSQHQVDTYRALTETNGPDVIFNTAMTGDGKSLAGQLPALLSGWEHALFAMYPTNELIRDQLRQARQTWSAWRQMPGQVRHLDSIELDRLLEPKDFSQRGDALLSVLQNSDVVLTNPDIFHYIMQTFYRRQGKTGDAPDKIIGPLVELFSQFTFDEFHIFETPQVVSVLNAMLLIAEMMGHERKRFLFQSATPGALMQQYLERSGLTHRVITGDYLHQQKTPDLSQWRPILQGSDIHFATGTVEEWVEEHGPDTLLAFFQKHAPGAKGAVIVNSVAQAKRLVHQLRELLEPHGLKVGENTGLTSRALHAESYTDDLLVGTSTVDVGVDFQINFLLFESRDAGSFLQRLGRLGRHRGYERDGQFCSFGEHFEAHALLPPWTLETLFDERTEEALRLHDDMETDREHLIRAIDAAFPPVADFARYAQEWGALQSVRVCSELNQATVRSSYENLRPNLLSRYQQTFQTSMNKKIGDFVRLGQEQPKLLAEATAFRGGSYFTCGILDASEEGADAIKTYDLFALIANAHLSPLEEEEFWQVVDRCGLPRRPLKRQEPMAFFRLHGFREERTQYHIALQQDLMTWDASRFGVATVVSGVTIDTEFAHDIPGLNAINRKLARRKLPALLCAGHHPLDLKRRLRLPLLFPLYALRSRDGLNEGTIAFGREALLLDVALKYRQIDCGGGALFL